jgi:LPXTG-motif cell wall-anchored protein
MTLLKGLGTGLCLTALCVLVAPKAKADDFDRKSIVTFSAPVEVGGSGAQILPAGTYVFKVINSGVNNHIVQISSQDESHVFTLIMAMPNYRLKSTSKTVMTFSERPVGQPEALKAWFYPGHDWGEQFVYARPRAIQLASETNEPVLSTPAVIAAAPVEVLTAAPVEAVTPKGETVETAQVVEAPPAPAAVAAPVEVASLPKTASNLGLIGIIGLILLGSGFLLPVFSKKSI